MDKFNCAWNERTQTHSNKIGGQISMMKGRHIWEEENIRSGINNCHQKCECYECKGPFHVENQDCPKIIF